MVTLFVRFPTPVTESKLVKTLSADYYKATNQVYYKQYKCFKVDSLLELLMAQFLGWNSSEMYAKIHKEFCKNVSGAT